MAEKHESLAAALAAFQAQLPHIGKGNTANVPTKTGGSYSYKYADLSDVSATVLPAMAAHGLSFSCKPTLVESGAFVLAYVLRHASGESDEGTYPLPTSGTAQTIGSAITYARRYVLCSIAGVAPDEDDDGQAAQNAYEYRAERRPQQRGEPAEAAEPARNGAGDRAAASALAFVRRKADGLGVSWEDARVQFARRYEGEVLDDCGDATRLAAFAKLIEPVANGVQA